MLPELVPPTGQGRIVDVSCANNLCGMIIFHHGCGGQSVPRVPQKPLGVLNCTCDNTRVTRTTSCRSSATPNTQSSGCSLVIGSSVRGETLAYHDTCPPREPQTFGGAQTALAGAFLLPYLQHDTPTGPTPRHCRPAQGREAPLELGWRPGVPLHGGGAWCRFPAGSVRKNPQNSH